MGQLKVVELEDKTCVEHGAPLVRALHAEKGDDKKIVAVEVRLCVECHNYRHKCYGKGPNLPQQG